MHKKLDKAQTLPLVKNPQFLYYSHETWSKWSTHELITLTKFHEDTTKIIDFLLTATFELCPIFYASPSMLPQPQKTEKKADATY